MIRLATIFAIINLLLISGGLIVRAQPVPPAPEWSYRSLLVWQVPEPAAPVTHVTLTLPTPFTIQSSPDLVRWSDTVLPAVITFTVTNDAPQKFFRLVNRLDFDPVTNAAGYRVYLGRTSGSYEAVQDLGTNAAFRLPPASHPTFATVTAYDADGNESDFSNEVNF
jgi:hypothetical protein